MWFERFLRESGRLRRTGEISADRGLDDDSSWRITLSVIAVPIVAGIRIAPLAHFGCDPLFLPGSGRSRRQDTQIQ